jgi:alkaline phosphatase
LAGYPLIQSDLLPYTPLSAPPSFWTRPFNGIFDVVYDLNQGHVVKSVDTDGVPYTALGYANGPGFRGSSRVDPELDPFPGNDGAPVSGPNHPEYLQEATVPLSSETHSAEEVAIYAIGPGAEHFRGTVKNTVIRDVMAKALNIE